MSKFRIIPKLEIKGSNVVKGIRMEGLRVVGTPEDLAKKYILAGADELMLIDTVASLYNRNHLGSLISDTSVHCDIPMLVGGGLRNLIDIKNILRAGADKVSLNTTLHSDISLLSKASLEFGSQSIVASVQAKRKGTNQWDAFYLNGRENSKTDILDWVRCLCDNGVGELIVTSVDNDGTKRGLDRKLIEKVVNLVDVPIVVCGGVATVEDVLWAAQVGASGIALAHVLHFNILDICEIKDFLERANIDVRNCHPNWIHMK